MVAWWVNTTQHTHIEHLLGGRVHAQSALQHGVAVVDFQKSDVQADHRCVDLGPENHFHSAVVIHIVFGDRPVGGVQFRVQEHLVALRLDGQKRRVLTVRVTRVWLLYERITIYVLNNDNINPINVRVSFFVTGTQ